jgi:hypothetical protein
MFWKFAALAFYLTAPSLAGALGVTTVSDSLGRFELRIAFVRADAQGRLLACKQGFYPGPLPTGRDRES